MNNMEHIVNTVRKYADTFGAFQIVFEDGEVYTCKTPVECKIGLYRVLYMKKHPETYKHIMTIRLPEEEGTTYWMRQAYGKVVLHS